MWQTFLLAAVGFGAVFAAMAIGVIISNRRLKGSCGGLANFRDSQGNSICEACTNPSPECQGEPIAEAAEQKSD